MPKSLSTTQIGRMRNFLVRIQAVTLNSTKKITGTIIRNTDASLGLTYHSEEHRPPKEEKVNFHQVVKNVVPLTVAHYWLLMPECSVIKNILNIESIVTL